MNLIFSDSFIEELEQLVKRNSKYRQKARKCFHLLATDPNYPSLRLHKLEGSEIYSVSVDLKIRILLHLLGDNAILLRIGTHDDVY